MPLPLDGVVVVSCEQAVAAPLTTRHLADLGARVIKVERPGSGDFARDYDDTVHGLSSHFVWLNRSKESVALDLTAPESRDTMMALLARADVFVQNFAPGAAERLGLGVETVRERFPQLVACSISGYGSSGPYRDAKAYDLLIQAEAGLVAVTGTEEHPAKSGVPVADIGAGMYAFSGILAALYERERTGEGSAFEVSLFDALTEWMGFPLYYAAGSGAAPRRTGTSHAAIAPYGAFTAGDGAEVVLAVQNEREWERFCADVLGDAALAVDERFATGSARVENRPALHEAIDAVFGGLTRDQVVERLASAGIANARRRPLTGDDGVLSHPQLSARDRCGAPSGHPSARSTLSSRRSPCTAARRGWTPSPTSGSTPTPSSRGSTRDRTCDDGAGHLGRPDRYLRPRLAGGPTFPAVTDTRPPAWRRRTRGEHRWPVATAIVVVVALQLTLPDEVVLGSRWLLPAFEVGLLAALLFMRRPFEHESRRRRVVSLALTATISVANAISIVLLVRDLLGGRGGDDPGTLLTTGGSIWAINVITFGLGFWQFDRGGPAARAGGERDAPDFLFVQMQSPDMAPAEWEPTFVDYLYVAFTNATAFSPTDTMPLSHWAKAAMMAQSATSLVTVALVVARAVNVLK